jgi:site-specific recombinase XerD
MLGLPLYLRGTTYYLHTRIAGKQVKRSLDTGHRRVAILRAIALLNDLHMSQRSTPPSKYEIDIGRGIFKANGAEDHKQMLEALAALTNAKVPIAQTAPAPIAAPPQEDDASALRLGELLEKYLLFKQLTPATVRGYRLTVEELATFLGNPRITRVTRSDLVRFQEHLRTKGNGLRTVGKKLSTIITLFDFAKDHTYTRHDNPATGLGKVSKKEKRKSSWAIFKREEIETILRGEFFQQRIKTDPDYAHVVLLGLFTGLRIGEITSLKKSQFHVSVKGTHYISIEDSKTSAGIREVPIHNSVYNYLQPFLNGKSHHIFRYADDLEKRKQRAATIKSRQTRLSKAKFPKPVDEEEEITGNAASKMFSRNIKDAGVTRPKLVFHSLRKFVNNSLLQKGVSLEIRSQFIGHEVDHVNVEVYTENLSIDALAAAVFPAIEYIYEFVSDAVTPGASKIDLSQILTDADII